MNSLSSKLAKKLDTKLSRSVQISSFLKHHVNDAFEKELLEPSQSAFGLPQQPNDPPRPESVETELVFKEINLQLSQLNEEQKQLTGLVELNLHNIGLTNLDIKPLQNLRNLKKLILSFNKLKSLKELTNMVSCNLKSS